MRLAVVLFNLGGPDGLESVEPFLFNLFNDPAIVGLPWPLRPLLARLAAWRRGPAARRIYERIGGSSPLLSLTLKQATALEARLGSLAEARVFVAMRYWQPRSDETAFAVKDFAPEAVVLLPLYPQFSTTTSASSFRDWREAARNAGLEATVHACCCYPLQESFVAAQADLVAQGIAEAAAHGTPRVLFSAHGLPKRVLARGDPYAWQVERTARAVAERLGKRAADWVVCYQSRIGPLAWIGPSTEEELERAARDRVPVVVVPIAFVSEHSETVVELDMEYRAIAEKLDVPAYVRVPAMGTHPDFIDALAQIVRRSLAAGRDMVPGLGADARLCPAAYGRCPADGAR